MAGMLAVFSSSSDESAYESMMQGTQSLYDNLTAILVVCAVIMAIISIFFLMFTRNDKQVTEFKSALKKICITVTIFLMLGSVYFFLMSQASDGSWDPDTTISTESSS